VSKVINIQDHVAIEKQKKQDEERKQQVETAKKLLLCSSCRMRCARCGVQMEPPGFCPFSSHIPFNLCPACAKEYEEYKRALDGLETQDIPWHNQEWKETWQAWIEYQKALKNYQNSHEVQELLKND